MDEGAAKYYYAGAQRIAVRTNGTLNFLFGDHLGSTSLVTDIYGNAVLSELRYTPWGEVRYNAGTTPTDYTYTGQYSNTADFGLMFYNARWYDPYLGRMAQADTIIPPGVQGLDRYAYTENDPVNYTDPSGHARCSEEGECFSSNPFENRPNLGGPHWSHEGNGNNQHLEEFVGPPVPPDNYNDFDYEFTWKPNEIHLLDKNYTILKVYYNGKLVGYKIVNLNLGQLKFSPNETPVFPMDRGTGLVVDGVSIAVGYVVAKVGTQSLLAELTGGLSVAVGLAHFTIEATDYLYSSTTIEVTSFDDSGDIIFIQPNPNAPQGNIDDILAPPNPFLFP